MQPKAGRGDETPGRSTYEAPQPVRRDRLMGFHTLFFEHQNTGLTATSTEFSMWQVADRDLRSRFAGSLFRIGSFRGLQGV